MILVIIESFMLNFVLLLVCVMNIRNSPVHTLVREKGTGKGRGNGIDHKRTDQEKPVVVIYSISDRFADSGTVDGIFCKWC